MAKGKSNPNDNDYLEQLHWRSRHPRRWPVRYEPKWKYKISYKQPAKKVTLFNGVLIFLVVASVFFVIAELIPEIEISNDNIPGVVISGGISVLFFAIIFFALRDGAKKMDKDDDSEDSD